MGVLYRELSRSSHHAFANADRAGLRSPIHYDGFLPSPGNAIGCVRVLEKSAFRLEEATDGITCGSKFSPDYPGPPYNSPHRGARRRSSCRQTDTGAQTPHRKRRPALHTPAGGPFRFAPSLHTGRTISCRLAHRSIATGRDREIDRIFVTHLSFARIITGNLRSEKCSAGCGAALERTRTKICR